MTPVHKQLAAGRWQSLSLLEQLANVGSEVARAGRWYESDRDRCEQAFVRALELLDLTIADPRWKGRRKELTRARELLCDAMYGGTLYGSDWASLDRYFFHFAVAARLNRRMAGRQ
ncbi:MAG: hypothetical protein NNA23_08480 [Nitrospira sp.]|nr:hypothetical protein [Nitrospira sp.]MCP9465613.1 hypothetical protein [Nitrospira sp.]